ncbi:MAG: O-antigen ligase domain-containing protein [Phycisphaerales bacterium]
MSLLVPLAMFGWIPALLILFAAMPSRRAVIVGFLGAWMFLPMAGYPIQGLPDYTKSTATALGVLLATAIFDGNRLLTFRFRLIDLPMLAYCTIPVLSALSAGYGLYEGISSILNQSFMWGIPYFIGRLFFRDLESLRELAVGIFIGGLVYMPLCLFEIRMSPQLHNLVYGFHQHDFLQTLRGAGYRPTVFMQHGLAVGTFMCTAALAGVWLWRSRVIRTLWGIPTAWLALALLLTAILCKSTGATALMFIGLGTLFVGQALGMRWLLLGLALAPVAYVLFRTVGGWSGSILVEITRLISDQRAESLQTRIDSETNLWRLVQPDLFLGSGRFVYAALRGEVGVIPDGMWIIALGCNGLFGLAAFLGAMVLPSARFARRYAARYWNHPTLAPAVVLAAVCALYMCDCLFNAMINPVLLLALGGLATLVSNPLPRPVPAVARAEAVAA